MESTTEGKRVTIPKGPSGIDVFCKWMVVLYVHGITGGSGMQQAFLMF